MILNAPPRHGKSFTATNFVEWVLGVNPLEKIMSASYNEDLSKVFSKKVRTTIEMEKLGENLVYNDIFPSTKIKFGSSEAMKWQTDASTQINYLATSPNGTATGFGANLEVVDDLIKNAEDAKRSWFEAAIEDGFSISEPDDFENYSGQFKLRIPKSLHKSLSEHSKAEGISMNQYCLYLLTKNDSAYVG